MTAPLASRMVDVVLDRSLLGYTKLGLGVRRALPGWPADPAPGSLSGRHVLVTGASSGLGIATAAGLAELGATVHMVVRDEAKGQQTLDSIKAEQPTADLRLTRCDIGDLDDVRRFAAEVRSTLPAVHAVVHNAGVMPAERTESADGHELSMAVHVLGPVTMTGLLRPVLSGGRVVFVSSGGMYAQELRADDPEYRKGEYTPTAAYARSKRMQAEMAPLLADLWSADDITVATMHPGWADTPGVRESLPTFQKVTKAVLRDDAQGADTSVWLSAIEPAPLSGRFWHDRRERPLTWFGANRTGAQAQTQAWEWLRRTAQV